MRVGVDDVRPAVIGDQNVPGVEIAMNHILPMDVIEDVAQPACELRGLTYRKRAPAFQNVIERLSFEIFQYYVRSSLLCNWYYLQNTGMIQFRNDPRFMRKPRGVSGTAFEFGVRDFKDNHLAGVPIHRLEDRRHPASFDES
jgi:hypothetical protein